MAFSNLSFQNSRYWIIDIAPLVITGGMLWIKLIYFSISLRSIWWMPESPFLEWIIQYSLIFSTTLAIILIILSSFLLLPRLLRYAGLLILNAGISTIILANLVHVHFYGDVISISSTSNITTLRLVIPSVIDLINLNHVLFYADILIFILLISWYTKVSRQYARMSPGLLRTTSLAIITGGIILLIPSLGFIADASQRGQTTTNLQRDISAQLGILPYYILDSIMHVKERRSHIGEAEVSKVNNFIKNQNSFSDQISPLHATAYNSNIIIISAESLQSFPIDLEIDGQLIMPRLKSFADQSLNFANFYDQTHLGTTSDAEFMTLQSLHPLPVGVVSSIYSQNRFYGLPTILAQHGYSTMSACGAPAEFWNMETMHRRLGFNQSFYEDSYEMNHLIGGWLADHEFYSQTLSFIQDQPEPFFAFMLTSSNHHPYDLPSSYYRLKLGHLEGTRLGDYLHSAHYFDWAFGQFIDRLKEVGLLDRTVLVVYGDHEGFLGDPPELAQLLQFPEDSSFHYTHVRKRVPLLIRLPGGIEAGVRTVAGGHIDTAPTVLSLLGIRDKSAIMLGRDLTLDEDDMVVFRDGSYTDSQHYFLNRFGPITSSTCFYNATGETFDCTALQERHSRALERLKISDLIIRGDLIPTLRGEALQQ